MSIENLSYFSSHIIFKLTTRIDVYGTLCLNRCLYINVAKLGTGVGSAEMSHLQNCSLKIYFKRALGGGWGRVGGSGWIRTKN